MLVVTGEAVVPIAGLTSLVSKPNGFETAWACASAGTAISAPRSTNVTHDPRRNPFPITPDIMPLQYR
jgi:hypothetical protein